MRLKHRQFLVLLTEQGYDAIHLIEQNLERIRLTVDLDFAQLLAISGESLPSIISFRLASKRKPPHSNVTPLSDGM